jgi:hypothetical protein
MFSSNTTQVSDGGYQISRSLRFNTADTAYLTRTPASASNRKTWTWSAWVKRGTMDRASRYTLFASRPTANPYTVFYFSGSTQSNRYGLRFEDPSADLATTQVFRDPSAWYHIVLAVDTTQATASNRIKMYVNGSQITVFSTASYPSQNTDMLINNTTEQCIGDNTFDVSTEAYDGYMTEINFIDGSQLTPSSFGETNADTGVWQPKAYSGAYGTNGFELNFSDNSNNTATTLGKDSSGNGNNWTPTGFSVTAGAGNDSLVDSPTSYGTDTGVGGTVRGNYATLDPLNSNGGSVAGTYYAPIITNGNLQLEIIGGVAVNVRSTIGMSTGKWYWELVGCDFVGISNLLVAPASSTWTTSNGWGYYPDGTTYTGGAFGVAYGVSWSRTDVIGVALNMDTGSISFYVNGSNQGVAFSTGIAGKTIGASLFNGASGSGYPNASVNFGQRPFAYTAPSGFKALCTQNLPTPTIGATTATQAGKFFNPVLYTGNGTTQTVTVGFQPDLVWCKSRSNAYWHSWIDAVRGRGFASFSNRTNAEFTSPVGKELTAFTSDGFSLGPDDGFSINSSGSTFVSWNWKANGSGSTNTAGSITSTVSANTTSGFSVVTYTGQAGAGTVGHGLGVAPAMIIVKSRSNGAYGWAVWHSAFTQSEYLLLDTSDAIGTASNYWNSSAPSTWTSAFGVGAGPKYNNNSGDTFVAYCFAQIAGYSAFGSYTGNGSADGPFVYTGFRPAYVVLKSSVGVVQVWIVVDSARFPYNVVSGELYPSTAGTESSGQTRLDLVSNGFKLRTTDTAFNQSSCTYIYMAFAENPFKYSLAR